MRHNVEIGVLVLWLLPRLSPAESSLAVLTQCLSTGLAGVVQPEMGILLFIQLGLHRLTFPYIYVTLLLSLKGENYV